MSAPERNVGDGTVERLVSGAWMDITLPERDFQEYIRDLAIDLKNARRYSKELETQLELMTHHRNRLLDKRDGFTKVDGETL
jgi:hypothetical protein